MEYSSMLKKIKFGGKMDQLRIYIIKQGHTISGKKQTVFPHVDDSI